jgi:hypothetical protein
MLDFEMSIFNINYKKNRLDNNILHIYGIVDYIILRKQESLNYINKDILILLIMNRMDL